MTLTVETKMLRPVLCINGSMYFMMEVTIKDKETVLSVTTLSEAGTPGENIEKYSPVFKAKIQEIVDRHMIECKLHADAKYLALADSCKSGLKCEVA